MVDHPLVVRLAAVEQCDPVLESERRYQVLIEATQEPCSGCIGERWGSGLVRVPGATGPVDGQGVDPGQRLDLMEDLAELGQVVGHRHAHELLEDPGVVDVRVTVREGDLLAPTEHRHVEHGSVVGAPHRACLGVHGSTIAEHLHRLIGPDHVPHLVAVVVRRRRAVDERQLVQGEAVPLGEGVRPGDVVVEAHLDARRAEQRHAVAVELIRDGQVALPEPCFAAPWEVRVGQHDPASGGGDVTADGPSVGPRSGSAERRQRRGWVRAIGSGRLGPPDQVHEVPSAAHQRHVDQVGVQVELANRAYPLGAGTPPGERVLLGQLGQAPVVAVHIAGDELTDPRRLGIAQLRCAIGDSERQIAQVRRQVVLTVSGSVEERPFAADLDDLVGDRR